MERKWSWWSVVVLAVALGAGAAGCGGTKDRDDGDRSLRIAVIPKGTTHVFWQSIHAGARAAAEEATAAGWPVEIIWKGPLVEDDRAGQVAVVETFIGQRVDGIVLAPLDSRALVPPVQAARAAGLPVVVIDSPLEDDGIVSLVATDNFAGGRLAGEELARLLGGQGNVLLLRYQVGSASTEAREAGFLAAIAEHPGLKVISDTQYAGATRESARTAAENLLTRHGREADGIFTPNESSTNGMLLALRALGRAGAIKLVGFDGGDQNLAGLRAGEIQALVLQDPHRMGYLGVRTLLDHLEGKPVAKVVDTGAKLVTAESAVITGVKEGR